MASNFRTDEHGVLKQKLHKVHGSLFFSWFTDENTPKLYTHYEIIVKAVKLRSRRKYGRNIIML